MKVLFAGSPESSARILNSIIEKGLEVVGVISQPDKRSQRGNGKEPSPVSREALKLGIPTFKPIALDKSFKKEIDLLDFDFLLVSAYGKILPDWLLESPDISPINIHFSLLPKYRGASPIQAAILNNDTKTGVSIMKMIKGMDEGPVYYLHDVEILGMDSRRDLENKLTSLCIQNIVNDLNNIFSKRVIPIEQNNADVSYCKKIDKLSGKIEFSKENTSVILQKHKAYFGWPGLYFKKNNTLIKIHGLEEYQGNVEDLEIKFYKFIPKGLVVKTADALIVITHLQFPGKRIIPAADAANSYTKFFEE
ncbi:MAG: methionyl-tRNA formyltransferase [Gammaproteobacteria bacterium]|tara:strand:+ start:548 stop:1468 length:921 start_codon:yes stop_codon:yes gene_type:complete